MGGDAGVGRLWAAGVDLAKLPAESFASLVGLVNAAPDRLTARISGTHLFFLGEAGARATVRALDRLLRRERALSAALDRLLGPASG